MACVSRIARPAASHVTGCPIFCACASSQEGVTALHYAARESVAIIEALVAHNADVNAVDMVSVV